MDNADFRKLLVSSASGGDAGDEEGDTGAGASSFRRRTKKRAAPTELIAKGAGGRVDRNHLKEALEKEEKIKAMQQRQRGAARGGGYDEEDEEDEEGRPTSSSRAGRAEEEEDVASGGGGGGGNGGYKGKKSGAPTHLSSSASGGQQDDGAYRDRAEERRKGINPDYEDEIARLVHMDAEKTKYLGGDVKHTHLVKGLDYALLQKVKAEMDAKKEEEAREREEEEGAAGGAMGGGAAAETRARQRKTMEAVSTRTLLAKSLKTFWAQQYSDEVKPVDMFRTSALEYTLGSVEDLEGETAAPLPTLISRSKVEVDMERESPLMLYRLPSSLMGRLTKAFVTYRQVAAGLKKKVKKRHRAEEDYGSTGGNTREGLMNSGGGGAKARPKVEIGDIFGDSGVGGEEVTSSTTEKVEGKKKKAVLQELGWEKEKEEEEGQMAAAAAAIDMDVAKILGDAGLGGEGKKKKEEVEEQPELFAGSRGKDKKRLKSEGKSLALAGGGYDEYFPSTYGGMDSDDEERGGGRGGEEGGGGEKRGKGSDKKK